MFDSDVASNKTAGVNHKATCASLGYPTYAGKGVYEMPADSPAAGTHYDYSKYTKIMILI